MSSTNNLKKPLWLRSPWNVLFDIVKLHRVKPWEIDLVYILRSLMEEMRRIGYIDFTASGMALLSSATIFRMKSELVLKLQEPSREPPAETPIKFLPPPLQLPYRFEYTSTTIANLLKALEDALWDEARVKTRPKVMPISPAPPPLQELDPFLININENINEMYQRISQLMDDEGSIPLSKITSGLNKRESVRTFLLILFIACRGAIQLHQDTDLGEIYITLSPAGNI